MQYFGNISTKHFRNKGLDWRCTQKQQYGDTPFESFLQISLCALASTPTFLEILHSPRIPDIELISGATIFFSESSSDRLLNATGPLHSVSKVRPLFLFLFFST
jgi:hypothetical protein